MNYGKNREAIDREFASTRPIICCKHNEPFVRKRGLKVLRNSKYNVFVCRSCVAEAKASIGKAIACFHNSGAIGVHKSRRCWPNKLGVTW
jgi:hypothetical protein